MARRSSSVRHACPAARCQHRTRNPVSFISALISDGYVRFISALVVGSRSCSLCIIRSLSSDLTSTGISEDRATEMHVHCSSCSARFRVDDDLGGRRGVCSQCDHRFILPIPCPERLLTWAKSAPWDRLLRFVMKSGARGHSRQTVNALIRVYENRRWIEEGRARRQRALAENRPVLSRRERVWARSERQLRRKRTLEELQELSAAEFEGLIANLFDAQELDGRVVGGTADDGVDVRILDNDGGLWGVAQCKRYDENTRVSAGEVRDFAGAYMLSNAPYGFFFTTGRFTRHAKRTARGFPWLKTYNGRQLVKYIEAINELVKDAEETDTAESPELM